MGDLDDRDAGVVERLDDVVHLLRGELVPLVVRAVAQAGVGEAEVEVVAPTPVERVEVRGHHLLPSSERAMFSPTRAAAAVMMSRLPAYGGR